jgi:hypothetical protein
MGFTVSSTWSYKEAVSCKPYAYNGSGTPEKHKKASGTMIMMPPEYTYLPKHQIFGINGSQHFVLALLPDEFFQLVYIAVDRSGNPERCRIAFDETPHHTSRVVFHASCRIEYDVLRTACSLDGVKDLSAAASKRVHEGKIRLQ